MENWYFQKGEESDVVISTRVRLARNLRSIPFIIKESKEDGKKLYEKVKEILPSIGYGLKLIKLEDIDEITLLSLIEKHLITPDFARNNHPYSAIAINNEENICLMINEEDHIKIQAFAAGLALEEAANLVIDIDEKLNKLLDYACDEQFGYLTSNPNHVGTGMKASVILHLPGLQKTGNLSPMLRVINNYSMSVQGDYGEGSEIKDNFYQISNIQSLGITEKNIIKNMKAIVERTIEQERVARKYLVKRDQDLEDRIYRAYGILTYAKKMTEEEALKLLSEIKLGVDLGIIDEINDEQIRKLQLNMKFGTMQKYLGERLDIRQSNLLRTKVVDKLLKEKND